MHWGAEGGRGVDGKCVGVVATQPSSAPPGAFINSLRFISHLVPSDPAATLLLLLLFFCIVFRTRALTVPIIFLPVQYFLVLKGHAQLKSMNPTLPVFIFV